MKALQDLHANRMMVVDLRLTEDIETIAALSNDAADEFSVDEDGSIWGHSVDEIEYEDNLTIILLEANKWAG